MKTRKPLLRSHPFPDPFPDPPPSHTELRNQRRTIVGMPPPERLPAGRKPYRCLFCGDVVEYDLELSANLNNAGCRGNSHGLHVGDPDDAVVVDDPDAVRK